MTPPLSRPPVSRRRVIRGAAGLGLLAPAAHVAPARVQARDAEGPPAYHGHPAVGVWIEGSGPPFEYVLFHADGIYRFYHPWLASVTGQGDPHLPALAFGVWRPTGERTAEIAFRIAWGDADVTSLMTAWARVRVDDSGDRLAADWRLRMVDRVGSVLMEEGGTSSLTRLRWEPFEEPATPEATPGA